MDGVGPDPAAGRRLHHGQNCTTTRNHGAHRYACSLGGSPALAHAAAHFSCAANAHGNSTGPHRTAVPSAYASTPVQATTGQRRASFGSRGGRPEGPAAGRLLRAVLRAAPAAQPRRSDSPWVVRVTRPEKRPTEQPLRRVHLRDPGAGCGPPGPVAQLRPRGACFRTAACVRRLRVVARRSSARPRVHVPQLPGAPLAGQLRRRAHPAVHRVPAPRRQAGTPRTRFCACPRWTIRLGSCWKAWRCESSSGWSHRVGRGAMLLEFLGQRVQEYIQGQAAHQPATGMRPRVAAGVSSFPLVRRYWPGGRREDWPCG